jgi:hypothetical protein
MPNFAIVSGNVVTQIVIADNENIALGVNYQNALAVQYNQENLASIGAIYDKDTNTFTLVETKSTVGETTTNA